VIVGGKANKRDVLLKLPTVIGRSRQADLTVAHPMVSRRHCELFEVDGLLTVRDLGSLNGTLVGGERIQEAALRPKDEFSVGPLTFRVEYEYTGEVPAAPPAGQDDEKAPDFQVVDEEGESLEGESAAGDQVAAAGIAPPEGELPDFQAWGQEEGEPDFRETEPSAPSSEEPAGHAAGEVGRSEGEEAAGGQPLAEGPPPLEVPADEPVEQAGAPAADEPDIEHDIEPGIKSGIESDIEQDIESDIEQDIEQDIESNIESDIEQDIEPDIEQDIEPDIEAWEGPRTQAAAQEKEKVEQLPESPASPGGGPQEAEEEEPEEEPGESAEDQALNDFLKGLT
jgi:hypothetical protein